MRPTRRSLGLVIATTLFALVSVTALTVQPAMAGPFANDPQLTYSAVSGSVISSLRSQVGTTTLSTVLNSGLNRTMVTGSACAPAAISGITGLTSKLCFDSGDQAVTYWRPQGVAGTPERMPDPSQDWASTGKKPMIVTWYDRADGTTEDNYDKGVRISVIDPASGKYRHILLAEPFTNSAGNPSYRALAGDHASGLAWIGDYLYLTDAENGLKVFSFANLLNLSGSKAAGGLPIDRGVSTKVGRHDSVWYSFGYSYVLLQVGTWKMQRSPQVKGSSYACDTTSTAPNIDFADTDRTANADSPLLVTGEFCHSGRYPTVSVWPFLKMHDRVKSGTGSATVTATKTFTSYAYNPQGGTMVGGTLHVLSGWKCEPNYLVSYNSAGTQTYSRRLPYGSEDAMYDRGTKRIYSVTELETGYADGGTSCGGRVLFSVAAP